MSAGQLRRRLENDLLRGHLGRQDPWRALDDDVAHNAPILLAAGEVQPAAPCPANADRGGILLTSDVIGWR
ncbi:hypothetical protein DT019_36165 [Streptomyces sp. SDr-06]|nr:hypothetical protein DT019_36165 [Streptomyces sp. SDr-06]